MSWVLSKDPNEEAPKVKPSSYNPSFYATHKTGTTFEVQLDSQQLHKKNVGWSGWEFVLRNYTAIGFMSMSSTPEWVKNTKVNLTIVDRHGVEIQPPQNKSSQLEFSYQLPSEVISPVVKLKDLLDKYKDRASIPKSETNKYAGMYQEWKITDLESLTDDATLLSFAKQHNVNIYGFFSHTAKIWKEVNEKLSSDKRRKFWRPGIQVVTENMPTGRVIDIDLNYGGGNKDRAFIVIELNDVRPDYGRKIFGDDVTNFVQTIASKIVSHFVINREVLKSTKKPHGGTDSEQQFNADLRIESARELNILDIDLPFEKEPQFEQDVVGLFHVLIGANILKGYRILSVSSGAQYDGVMRYYLKNEAEYYYDGRENLLGIIQQNFPPANIIRSVPKNLEFKYYLSDLIDEFESTDFTTKNFDDIFWVVTWEIGNEETFSKSGYNLEDLTINSSYTKRQYFGVTHHLYSNGNRAINVLVLKDVIRLLRKQ
ncbi:hypothetical protein V7158_27815 [Priestia megaterium]|uniref:hypothetical protein n=1 Tax=Priestia megaterium TaxID=1404 RepID=UPI002FFE77ED